MVVVHSCSNLNDQVSYIRLIFGLRFLRAKRWMWKNCCQFDSWDQFLWCSGKTVENNQYPSSSTGKVVEWWTSIWTFVLIYLNFCFINLSHFNHWILNFFLYFTSFYIRFSHLPIDFSQFGSTNLPYICISLYIGCRYSRTHLSKF
jgi:hypothetical protein